ncbi:hypothetical protein [Streptomyces bohaiensis]|uniref:Uncharacterized protein n=1 Tax=Streptomyces bohaiensis TaxID=1431344 RepID=A0ABX1C471_9ACTN|nr:hypothetical protein [Streptomyces bohaiensis]NJQ14016.1 hypothetical protein [Streptomyces bohaiensis]
MSADQSPEEFGPDDGTPTPGVTPDVTLDVPVLNVEEIEIEAEDLRANVTLQAELLDLLKINVGAEASLGRLNVGVRGVEVQALLQVHLDNVASMIETALTTLAENPEIVAHLARTAESAAQSVSGAASEALPEVGRAAADTAGHASRAVESVGSGAADAVGGAAESVVDTAGELTEDDADSAGAAAQGSGDVPDGAAEHPSGRRGAERPPDGSPRKKKQRPDDGTDSGSERTKRRPTPRTGTGRPRRTSTSADERRSRRRDPAVGGRAVRRHPP